MKNLILFIAVLFISSAAQAACYSQLEAEAEQGIRIHSELMVIGLTCQPIDTGVYNRYHSFTKTNERLFSTYEGILIKYFERNGSSNAEASFNALRTDLANKTALNATKMRPDLFCRKYAPRINKASTLNTDQIRRWAATIYPSHPVSKPMCANAISR